jgi:hypothetical protein
VADAARNGGRVVAAVAALFVVVLAACALWWPRPVHRTTGPVVLVLDPAGDERRAASVWPALGQVLGASRPTPPQVVIVRTLGEFRARVAGRPDFLVCPDGVALGLESGGWVPLAAGRRPAPRNLRPHGVIVSRRGAEAGERPWLAHPESVVFGDSLSLSATGVWRRPGAEPVAGPLGCGWGPDPYDHAPALHALRLGGYAHAVVRQWDADRFRAQGLLSADGWTFREVTAPVPDLVLMADRRLPTAERLALGERLAGIGRALADLTPAERDLSAALPVLGLAGFNLLLEPDLERLRANFVADWPQLRP